MEVGRVLHSFQIIVMYDLELKRSITALRPSTSFSRPTAVDEQAFEDIISSATHIVFHLNRFICSSTCARLPIGNSLLHKGRPEPFLQLLSSFVPLSIHARRIYPPCPPTTLLRRARPLTELLSSLCCAVRSSCGKVSSLMVPSRVFSIMDLRLSSLRVRLFKSGVITSSAQRR
jgi:hypothetical protein